MNWAAGALIVGMVVGGGTVGYLQSSQAVPAQVDHTQSDAQVERRARNLQRALLTAYRKRTPKAERNARMPKMIRCSARKLARTKRASAIEAFTEMTEALNAFPKERLSKLKRRDVMLSILRKHDVSLEQVTAIGKGTTSHLLSCATKA